MVGVSVLSDGCGSFIMKVGGGVCCPVEVGSWGGGGVS